MGWGQRPCKRKVASTHVARIVVGSHWQLFSSNNTGIEIEPVATASAFLSVGFSAAFWNRIFAAFIPRRTHGQEGTGHGNPLILAPFLRPSVPGIDRLGIICFRARLTAKPLCFHEHLGKRRVSSFVFINILARHFSDIFSTCVFNNLVPLTPKNSTFFSRAVSVFESNKLFIFNDMDFWTILQHSD
jgi:hypothetical protein